MNSVWWLYGGVAASIFVNIFAVWYIRQLLVKFLFLSENISNLRYNLSAFGVHIKKIYGMDRFYGEPILENLLTHMKEVEENVDQFTEIFDTFEESTELDEADWDETATEEMMSG